MQSLVGVYLHVLQSHLSSSSESKTGLDFTIGPTAVTFEAISCALNKERATLATSTSR